MMLSEDSRVRFGICSRDGCGQLYLAIPELGWKTMEQGLSQEFNLTTLGVGLLVAMGRVRDRETALTMLRNHILVRTAADIPAPRESEVICGIGQATWGGQLLPIIVMLITERGRKAMQAGRQYEFDMRGPGLPLKVYLGAFATAGEAQAHIRSMVGDIEVRDFSDQDLSFTPQTGTRH